MDRELDVSEQRASQTRARAMHERSVGTQCGWMVTAPGTCPPAGVGRLVARQYDSSSSSSSSGSSSRSSSGGPLPPSAPLRARRNQLGHRQSSGPWQSGSGLGARYCSGRVASLCLRWRPRTLSLVRPGPVLFARPRPPVPRLPSRAHTLPTQTHPRPHLRDPNPVSSLLPRRDRPSALLPAGPASIVSASVLLQLRQRPSVLRQAGPKKARSGWLALTSSPPQGFAACPALCRIQTAPPPTPPPAAAIARPTRNLSSYSFEPTPPWPSAVRSPFLHPSRRRSPTRWPSPGLLLLASSLAAARPSSAPPPFRNSRARIQRPPCSLRAQHLPGLAAHTDAFPAYNATAPLQV